MAGAPGRLHHWAALPPTHRVLAAAHAADAAAEESRQAMVSAAKEAFAHHAAAYNAGEVDLAGLYTWSRRWMEAARMGQAINVRQRAAQEHLERMEQLHARMRVLHKEGARGGEMRNFSASEFYVAEARHWLANP